MPEVVEAFAVQQAAEKRALETAKEIRLRGHAILGRAIAAERAKGTRQEEIARKIERTREQVRRYEQTYREWVRDHPGESLD